MITHKYTKWRWLLIWIDEKNDSQQTKSEDLALYKDKYSGVKELKMKNGHEGLSYWAIVPVTHAYSFFQFHLMICFVDKGTETWYKKGQYPKMTECKMTLEKGGIKQHWCYKDQNTWNNLLNNNNNNASF